MAQMSEMTNYAKQARKQRLSGSRYSTTHNPLVGYCFENSFVLYHILSNHGLNPQLVAGASDRYSEDVLRITPPSELTTVSELGGLIHYWIECDDYVMDIAADIEDKLGEIHIQSSLPETYYRLSDSYTYGQKTIQNADQNRCTYCGDYSNSCTHSQHT